VVYFQCNKKYIAEKSMTIMASQIKDLRKKIGLTQTEFSKRVGVGLRFLRELEQGKTTVRLDKLMQVLDFLGYHLELKPNGPYFAGKQPTTSLNGSDQGVVL
jgi:y4mF family transcriptional regulator